MLLVGALVATGCGSDSSPGAALKQDEPATPKPVTVPTTDEDLDAEVGTATVALLRGAGCELGTYPLEKAEHVDTVDELDHKSFPPTSGHHFEVWAPFGLYDEPVADAYAVHNLEHGGVTVWFGNGVPQEDQDAIAALLDQDEKWLVAPRTDMDGLFSGAWGVGLYCPTAALDKLTPEQLADAVDTWYGAVVSTGSPAEKDVPAYAGSMKEPAPVKDISTEAPF